MQACLSRLLAGLKSGGWLNRRRVLAYGGILLAVELVTFGVLVAGTHGFLVKLARPTTTDFVSFYAAGKLADAGTPALAYHQPEHYAAEERATAPGIRYQFFYYPPIFLLLCAVLARLPYLVAFVAFEVLSLIAWVLVARRILREPGWRVIGAILAFPAGLWTLGLGQNAFLTASLFGAATLLIDRRPAAAGALFGALCFKPHIGILVPVALAAGRHWRAFAAAAATVAACLVLSLVQVGWQTWHDFLVAAAGMSTTYVSGRIDFAGFISPFGAVRLLGGGPLLAYGVQAAATLAAAALVWSVWRRRLDLPVRAATLAAATPVAVPVMLIYDLMIAAVALLWLVRAGRQSGFPPWAKTVLAGVFITPLLSRNIATAWHVPMAPMAALALLALAAFWAPRERRPRRATLSRVGAEHG
ncbi:MAG TPA: glycosyltransferase family 87 protein [Stellaceae bacterium]|nr:glycosyltransferase family 87 protein [Stellaceae bacterium]